MTRLTIAAYERMAADYAEDTRNRDLSADYALFFRYMKSAAPLDLLDLGCGPGRDLSHFKQLGHRATGLDGSARLVEMAEATGCPVLHQDFLKLDLPPSAFDGVFASASLFHIPPDSLHGVLAALLQTLRPGGVLFMLNPRGRNEKGWMGERFCTYLRLGTWMRYMRSAGFAYLAHEYRPLGVTRQRQQWLSSVWRKPENC